MSIWFTNSKKQRVNAAEWVKGLTEAERAEMIAACRPYIKDAAPEGATARDRFYTAFNALTTREKMDVINGFAEGKAFSEGLRLEGELDEAIKAAVARRSETEARGAFWDKEIARAREKNCRAKLEAQGMGAAQVEAELEVQRAIWKRTDAMNGRA